MEHPIGKPFKVNGVAYVAVKDRDGECTCTRCAAVAVCCIDEIKSRTFGECIAYYRSDRKNVHFNQFGVNF